MLVFDESQVGESFMSGAQRDDFFWVMRLFQGETLGVVEDGVGFRTGSKFTEASTPSQNKFQNVRGDVTGGGLGHCRVGFLNLFPFFLEEFLTKIHKLVHKCVPILITFEFFQTRDGRWSEVDGDDFFMWLEGA